MSKRRIKKKRKGFPVIIIYILCAVLVCFFLYKAFSFAFNIGKGLTSQTENNNETLGEEVHIVIESGSSTQDIAEVLKENGLIESVVSFRLTSKMGGYDGTYRHGKYSLQKGLSDEEIMKILQSGVTYAQTIKVTIPEGYTTNKIAQALEEAELISSEEFFDEMNNGVFDYEFLKDVPKRENYLEGYLFPATYDFPKDVSAHEIIEKFLDRFEISYENIIKSSSLDYTYDEIVIVASLIESEIQVPEERERAAGVIYNRLKEGMPLQIDSTVQYALSTRNEVVTHKDLEVDSPYNTYKNKGLPIGPICSPGDEAIKAAVNPENNKYIYYVVKQRGSGEHVFTETYDEFLKAKKEYQDNFNN